MNEPQGLLLHVTAEPDLERQRVVVSVSRSDKGEVQRWFLTPADVRRFAGQLLAAARPLDSDL